MGVFVSGTKARPDDTVTMAAPAASRKWGSKAAVSRIGASRLVVTVRSAMASQASLARSSASMMPALWTTTLRLGCCCTTRAPKPAIAAASHRGDTADPLLVDPPRAKMS